MKRKIVKTAKAPAAVGPYSQAVISGGFLFASGQVALIPGSGELLKGDIQTETKQVFENLKAVLKEAGATFEDVVKAHVYLTSMNDFAAVNEVYATYMGPCKPARSCVQVAALPKGANVEIDVIAKV